MLPLAGLFRLPRVENLLLPRAGDARLLPLGERFLIGLRSSLRPRQRIARRHRERPEREPFRQRLRVALPGETHVASARVHPYGHVAPAANALFAKERRRYPRER